MTQELIKLCDNNSLSRIRLFWHGSCLIAHWKTLIYWRLKLAEEEKKAEETTEESPETTPKKKGSMMKIIIFSVVGIIVVAGISVGTLFLLTPSDSASSDTASDSTHTSRDHSTDKSHATTDHEEEYDFEDENPIFDEESMMEEIMKNLAEMDYQPDESELSAEVIAMSLEDSLANMDWLDREKHRLSTWEDSLRIVRKDLEKLEQTVSQQIIRIEQVESAKTATLAGLYDGMDAKAVARLMLNLDDNTIVTIIPRMKTKQASAVLSLFPPKRAAKLSKKMITIAVK